MNYTRDSELALDRIDLITDKLTLAVLFILAVLYAIMAYKGI